MKWLKWEEQEEVLIIEKMSETFDTFKKRVAKVSETKVHKITNSYGVYDYYKYYRKNKPKDKKYILTESQYFAIIRRMNELMVEQFLTFSTLDFPERMGTIELRKFNIAPRLDEKGNVKFNAPIDWNKTLKLWYEDEESYHNKVLVKVSNREVFKINYNKSKALYNNKYFYMFRLNRQIKRDLKDLIKDNRIDAFNFDNKK